LGPQGLTGIEGGKKKANTRGRDKSNPKKNSALISYDWVTQGGGVEGRLTDQIWRKRENRGFIDIPWLK